MWTGWGKPQLVGRIGKRLENGARGDAVRGEGVVQPIEIPLSRLPGLDPAGIHDLDGVGPGRAEEPGGVVACPLPLAGGNLP